MQLHDVTPNRLRPLKGPKTTKITKRLRDSPDTSPRKRQRPLPTSGDSGDEQQENDLVSHRRAQLGICYKCLACPYYKSDPERHRSCSQVQLSKLSYVKQHLARKHPPGIHCSRCYETFDKKEAFAEHQRQDPPCKIQDKRELPGMTDEQLVKLKARSDPSKNEAGQWEEIWKILFPGKTPPASVYIELDIPPEVNELTERMAKCIPPRIVDRLSEYVDLASTSSDDLTRELTELVMEVASQWIAMRRGSDTSPG